MSITLRWQKNAAQHSNHSLSPRAFTLVELLVVIGIIALLISILLPSLNQARHAARTIVCASNLRQYGIGMQLYVNENKGFFPGPNTSGLALLRGGQYAGEPSSPTQDWDWVSPTVGRILNLSRRQPGETAETARLKKMLEIMQNKLQCPESQMNYGAQFSGTPLPGNTLPALMTYATPAYMHVLSSASYAAPYQVEDESTPPLRIPVNYVPKITKIGSSSVKIFAFEGARYWNNAPKSYFDFSTAIVSASLSGTPQGAFSSRGLGGNIGTSGEPYTFDVSSIASPATNKPSPQFKAASLRHNGRMQAVFFDGHVELMSVVDAAALEHWAPKDSVIKSGCFYNSMTGNTTRYAFGKPLP